MSAGAERAGVKVWREAFADRGYRDDGSLIPRGETGAILTTGEAVLRRVRMLCAYREIESVSGRRLRIIADTLCLHSDSSRSASLAAAIVGALQKQKAKAISSDI